MRTLKFVFIVLCLFAVSGCSCRTREIADDAAIPVAGEESVLEDIFFAFDSYSLCDKSKETLQAHAEWLKANPEASVTIEGHCDERGTNEYNMALGSRRANSAMEYLISLGVDASRMSTISYGEDLPLDPAHTEEAWAKNRRDHFVVK
ncbi:MAG: peptidoglycan-associated lipoprotein Pal [Bdellovibrionota bacterium]|jgi:peptidoglycan-associated lipoprotein